MSAIIIYGAYFAAAVVLPGTLVYRRIMGFTDSLLADVAWGSVTGLMIELLGWAAFTLAGVNRYLWVWPALIVLCFALVPSLRPMWRRPAGSGRTSLVAAWGTAVSSLLACAYLGLYYYRLNHLPPSGGSYFVDLPWHLGVAYEAVRSVPLQTVEATAEGTLHYHWFADAHFGAASLVSGVDLATIVVRTGLFPVIFVLVATTVSLAIKISHRPVVGALSGILVVATTAGAEFWTRLHKLRVVFPESPTGMYAIGISCLVAMFLVELARGKKLSAGAWGLFAVTCFAAVGSKPSNLLLLIPAVCLLLGVDLVRRKPLNRGLLIALAVMGVMFVISIFLFASPGGSTIKPSLLQVRTWRGKSGVPTPLPLLVLTALIKGYLLYAVSMVALASRRLWSDPAARLLGAVSLVGFAAAWIIYHPGLSQMFFWHSAIPFAGILSAWGLVLALEAMDERRRAWVTFAVAGGAAMVVAMVAVRFITDQRSRVLPGWLALTGTAIVIMVLAWRLRISPRTGFLLATVTVIALSTPVTLIESSWKPGPPKPDARKFAQTEAALWVEANTPFYDQFATNMHCNDAGPNCDARSFWLSGFGGRRVLLGGYGVSPEALRRADINGIKAWRQPYHDQELLQLNDGAFQNPDAATLRRLYEEYDVRWLVADLGVEPVSPALDDLARLEYSNDWIRVYRLDPALFGALTG